MSNEKYKKYTVTTELKGVDTNKSVHVRSVFIKGNNLVQDNNNEHILESQGIEVRLKKKQEQSN